MSVISMPSRSAMRKAPASPADTGDLLGGAILERPGTPSDLLGEPNYFRPPESRMASSAAEEYLQAIYTLADESGHVVSARLAEFLGFSAPAVSEMVHRLEREGLVSMDGHKEVHL